TNTPRFVALTVAIVTAGVMSLPAQGGGRGAGPGQGARDNQSQPTGTGTISGIVTSNTGGPVRRARVSLNGAELRGSRSVMTGDDGKFEFVSLPAGRFTLSASKAGYSSMTFGARQPGRAGTPIQLAEGQKLDKADIQMPRGGVVTGVVVDDSGEPAPGTRVRVSKLVFTRGERSLRSAGEDQTDDRGMYRIYGLEPGDYMVSALPRNPGVGGIRQAVMAEIESLTQQVQAAGGRGAGRAGGPPALGGRGGGQALLDRVGALQQQLADADQDQTMYAPVYYPGTTSPSNATTLTLGASEERGGVDFQLQLVQTARVDGSIVSSSGTLPQGVQVSLVPADRGGLASLPGLGLDSARVGQDGRFSFANVAPGQYHLQARGVVREVDPNAPAEQAARGRGGRGGPFGGRGGTISQVLWAVSDLSVNGTDLTNVVLTLQPGMTISGRVEFPAASQPDYTLVRVNLQPRGQQLFEIGGNVPAVVDANGRFTITGVAPGRYAIGANAGQGGGRGGGRGGGAAAANAALPQSGAQQTTQYTLLSSIANSVDTLDFPLEVQPNQDVNGVVLTFGDRTQELSGTIQDASGRPTFDYTIVLFAADRRFWTPQSRRIASTRPGTDGRFTFRGIPAGEYRLTAITDAEPDEWFNPSFLEQVQGASIPVSIREGEKKTQDVRVQGGQN
ncbi:MAG TPA: carboxypeptidase-like regulatory domain-containing protein, partial [Vicinamibacterales bacterium]|nr:carboxypeptidase-like regulatory domain-containing protein [Vicinamibacterales bacterium]